MKNTIYTKLHQSKLEIGKVSKNAKNPHFKKSYADINALLEAVEPILLTHGLILMQPISDGIVTTQIIDIETGEKVESSMTLPQGLTPQQAGSAITYFRRYTLQSLLSLQAVDDDGEGTKPNPQTTQSALPALTEKAFNQATERIGNGEDLLPQLKKAFAIKKEHLERLEFLTNIHINQPA
jgi:hypothetical protein